jgi:hypothetical protein
LQTGALKNLEQKFALCYYENKKQITALKIFLTTS